MARRVVAAAVVVCLALIEPVLAQGTTRKAVDLEHPYVRGVISGIYAAFKRNPEAVHAALDHPKAKLRHRVDVFFVIRDDGKLVSARVVRSSGLNGIDQLALRILAALRFPPPPPDVRRAITSYTVPLTIQSD